MTMFAFFIGLWLGGVLMGLITLEIGRPFYEQTTGKPFVIAWAHVWGVVIWPVRVVQLLMHMAGL